MLFNMAIVLILALIMYELFGKFKIPGILGAILVGAALGPNGVNFIHVEILKISGDLRLLALIIILLRAGFGIDKKSLVSEREKVLKMSVLPGVIEGSIIAIASSKLLGFSLIEGGMLGFIIAAVSPAIIVPNMLELKEKRVNSKLPDIILASSAIDDIVAITLFTTFLSLYKGGSLNIALKFAEVPISIGTGVIFGVGVGFVLLYLFKRKHIRDTKKSYIILLIAILMNGVEKIINSRFSFEIASLLGVMAIGVVIKSKSEELGKRLGVKFNKMWVFAELILFVLVGATVNLSLIQKEGRVAIIIIFMGLIGRSIGVVISLIKGGLTKREIIFGVISFVPKATVQAAMGVVPMASGVVKGEIILAISVVAIVITAPLGSLLLNIFGERLLVTKKD